MWIPRVPQIMIFWAGLLLQVLRTTLTDMYSGVKTRPVTRNSHKTSWRRICWLDPRLKCSQGRSRKPAKAEKSFFLSQTDWQWSVNVQRTISCGAYERTLHELLTVRVSDYKHDCPHADEGKESISLNEISKPCKRTLSETSYIGYGMKWA